MSKTYRLGMFLDVTLPTSPGTQLHQTCLPLSSVRESGAKKRARKPADSPRRPKSAYMFFLAEFREEWKVHETGTRSAAVLQKHPVYNPGSFSRALLLWHCLPVIPRVCVVLHTGGGVSLYRIVCMYICVCLTGFVTLCACARARACMCVCPTIDDAPRKQEGSGRGQSGRGEMEVYV